MSRSGVPSNAEKGCGGLKMLPRPLKPKTGRGDEDGAHCRSCPLSGPRTVDAVAVDGPAVVDTVPSLVGLLSGRETSFVLSSPMALPPRPGGRGVSGAPSSSDVGVAVLGPTILYIRRRL